MIQIKRSVMREMFLAVLTLLLAFTNIYSQTGISWVTRTSALTTNNFYGVTYGNGLFVAVAGTGTATGTYIMTSPDGVNWTARTSPAANNWKSVVYGNGKFVAVSLNGTGNRVMTSPDGITWTSRSSAADQTWTSVTYGNGLFVAVSSSGTGSRVMTSPDGITWTLRTSAADNTWNCVTFGNGTFVAVATTGASNVVMTSTDGITWTGRTSVVLGWRYVTYGNGIFVAVAGTGTGNRVMTSPDGITWTSRSSAADQTWTNVVYGGGLFVAVSITGVGSRVMTSPDGVTWTLRTTPADETWYGLYYSNGIFVASAASALSGTNIMTSGTFSASLPLKWLNFSSTFTSSGKILLEWDVNENEVASYEIERSADSRVFVAVSKISSKGNGVNTYDFTDAAFPGIAVWYRIKQTDNSGRVSYSNIIRINLTNKESTKIYPNPASEYIALSIDQKEIGSLVTVTNMTGTILQTLKINAQSFFIDISSYPAGIYIVKIAGRLPVQVIKENK